MSITRSVALLFAILVLGGCASTDRVSAPAPDPDATPRAFDGRTGQPIPWSDALAANLAASDVIILGEQHDHHAGHVVQQMITRRVLAEHRGGAVSLEMLERDEQALVNDYLDGIIDVDALEKETFSTNWGGKDSWRVFYQPVIDAAKEQGASVIAANAPRRYVRRARTDGYDALARLDADRRRLFDTPPESVIQDTADPYRQRFFELMGGGPRPESPDGMTMSEEQVTSFYRSQRVWDETMAASIVNALDAGKRPVIHLVGQFHSDYDGGLVEALRRLAPGAQISTVSIIPTDAPATSLIGDDADRADVVIYIDPAAATNLIEED